MNEILRFRLKRDKRTHGRVHVVKVFYNVPTMPFGHRGEITSWFYDRLRLGVIRTTLELIRTSSEVTRTNWSVGQSQGRDQESARFW